MRRLGYGFKLFGEIMRFARENRNYWLIPLFLMLGFAALLIATGQVSAPMLYTLF